MHAHARRCTYEHRCHIGDVASHIPSIHMVHPSIHPSTHPQHICLTRPPDSLPPSSLHPNSRLTERNNPSVSLRPARHRNGHNNRVSPPTSANDETNARCSVEEWRRARILARKCPSALLRLHCVEGGKERGHSTYFPRGREKLGERGCRPYGEYVCTMVHFLVQVVVRTPITQTHTYIHTYIESCVLGRVLGRVVKAPHRHLQS